MVSSSLIIHINAWIDVLGYGELYLALPQVQMEQMETRKRDWTRLVEHLSSVAPLTLPTC